MALYKVIGSYEEFYETIIEADNAYTAQQIFYQNAGHMSAVDGNWVDIRIDDEYEDEEELYDNDESVEFTMDNYDPVGGKVSV
jgi:hypothetical protein